MGWLSMMAELGVNINPFVRGMNRAKDEANKAGTKIGKDLKQKLWGAVGVGAVVGGMRKMFGDAREIERLHLQTQRSRQEIQAMQYAVDKTGLSFGDIAGIMDGTATDVLPSMRDKVLELVESFEQLGLAMDTHAVQGLTRAEDKMDVWYRRLQNRLAEAAAGWGNFFSYFHDSTRNMTSFEDFMANAGLDVIADEFFSGSGAQKNSPAKPEKEKVSKKTAKAIRAARFDLGAEVGNLPVDSMAAVGGFVGNASKASPVADIAREQLKVQQKIAENTDPEKRETAQFSQL